MEGLLVVGSVGYWGGLVGLEGGQEAKRGAGEVSDALVRLGYINNHLAGRQKKAGRD